MFYNPQTHLDLARAREQELLRDARRFSARPPSWNKRPPVLVRLGAFLLRRPVRPSAPVAG
jgi:hypothetical protein